MNNEAAGQINNEQSIEAVIHRIVEVQDVNIDHFYGYWLFLF